MKAFLPQMRPSFASRNSANLRLLNPKPASNFALTSGSYQRLYFYNLRVGKFRTPMFGAFARNTKARGIGMLPILLPSAPLQIVDAIISLISVDMVHLMDCGWWWAKKSFSNQAVDKSLVLSIFNTDGGSLVAIPQRSQAKYSHRNRPHRQSSISAQSASSAHPRYRPQTAQIRNLVRGFESHNCAPNFIHLNPPHADTFRGHSSSQSVKISK